MARQERRGDEDGAEILLILIHGDAAFAGRGVVAETFQLSQARGFKTAVLSVAPTTRGDSRSRDRAMRAPRPTGISPDDRGAGVPCEWRRSGSGCLVTPALEYRQMFHKDVVIDRVIAAMATTRWMTGPPSRRWPGDPQTPDHPAAVRATPDEEGVLMRERNG